MLQLIELGSALDRVRKDVKILAKQTCEFLEFSILRKFRSAFYLPCHPFSLRCYERYGTRKILAECSVNVYHTVGERYAPEMENCFLVLAKYLRHEMGQGLVFLYHPAKTPERFTFFGRILNKRNIDYIGGALRLKASFEVIPEFIFRNKIIIKNDSESCKLNCLLK
ncbi:hypothetical protein [Pantoea sp. paga]|uniref:hypothetical protein n=1 Tax=Pantoea sp. paga TaxID=2597519 RepID=UPI00117FBB8F|nr:hypothetical protein [Pantoea sp. paga]TSH77818.1 hypothetical protein FOV68_23740 [Pantoea sp. paga]